jgi:hypothetical protein
VLKNSNSQSYQESFVMSMLNNKRNGFYVEVGGYDAKLLSNTYVLETEYGWQGFSIEINKERSKRYNQNRNNVCINADATTFDYEKTFENLRFPKQIDYLQLDIEPAPNTLQCLYKMPMNYRYSVITFEHDLYAHPQGKLIQQKAREYLHNNGYKLVVGNVYAPKKSPSPFEDWFVDPNIVGKSTYAKFVSENIYPKELFG